MASCVFLSSFAIFLSISRFKSQFIRFGAMFVKSFVEVSQVLVGGLRRLTSSCARVSSSCATIAAAKPDTFLSIVSSTSSFSAALFRSVRDAGSKLRLDRIGSLHNELLSITRSTLKGVCSHVTISFTLLLFSKRQQPLLPSFCLLRQGHFGGLEAE